MTEYVILIGWHEGEIHELKWIHFLYRDICLQLWFSPDDVEPLPPIYTTIAERNARLQVYRQIPVTWTVEYTWTVLMEEVLEG